MDVPSLGNAVLIELTHAYATGLQEVPLLIRRRPKLLQRNILASALGRHGCQELPQLERKLLLLTLERKPTTRLPLWFLVPMFYRCYRSLQPGPAENSHRQEQRFADDRFFGRNTFRPQLPPSVPHCGLQNLRIASVGDFADAFAGCFNACSRELNSTDRGRVRDREKGRGQRRGRAGGWERQDNRKVAL